MSVPLDRLYNFIHDLCNHDILIYRFSPHGSRKIKDCTPLTPIKDVARCFYIMNMVCHDQEPLDPKLYSKGLSDFYIPGEPFSVLRNTTIQFGLYDKNLLLHSEKNSEPLRWFEEDGAIGVYYWCHALIARDWYRYAEVDPLIALPAATPKFDFLVYNRAWSGTREYRLRFAELVIEQQLETQILMNFSTMCDSVDYRKHVFKNPCFQIKSTNLESMFLENTASSASSADYDVLDYQQCGIEVVLETLFDDSRLHLTEKVFRPIVCKKPFILAATPGSLKYIKSYGFKTFSDYIDESYDLITDPMQRLLAIINLMKQISSMPLEEKHLLYQNMRAICEYNHKRFFSDEFLQDVVDELQTNLEDGIQEMQKYRRGVYFRRMLRRFGDTRKLPSMFSRDKLVVFWTKLRQWGSY